MLLREYTPPTLTHPLTLVLAIGLVVGGGGAESGGPDAYEAHLATDGALTTLRFSLDAVAFDARVQARAFALRLYEDAPAAAGARARVVEQLGDLLRLAPAYAAAEYRSGGSRVLVLCAGGWAGQKPPPPLPFMTRRVDGWMDVQ